MLWWVEALEYSIIQWMRHLNTLPVWYPRGLIDWLGWVLGDLDRQLENQTEHISQKSHTGYSDESTRMVIISSFGFTSTSSHTQFADHHLISCLRYAFPAITAISRLALSRGMRILKSMLVSEVRDMNMWELISRIIKFPEKIQEDCSNPCDQLVFPFSIFLVENHGSYCG